MDCKMDGENLHQWLQTLSE